MADPKANVNPTGHINVGSYNPYNGKEALDLVMKRIYNQLREHQDFMPHLAYTKFEYSFSLNFKAESLEPVTIKGKSSFEIRPVEKEVTTAGTSPQAPDDGRREAGLVIPSPTLTNAGMVDIPLQAQIPGGQQL